MVIDNALIIRPLTAADAEAYRAIRLRALQEHSEAYTSSYDEELPITVADWEKRLATDPSESATFGAFVDNTLVGITTYSRLTRQKQRHRALIVAVYVAPEARGQGVARRLLDAAVAHARTIAGVRDLVLAVTVGNDVARDMYRKAGFVTFAREPHHICIEGQFYDIDHMILYLEGG